METRQTHMNWKLIVEYENDYYAHHTNHYLCHGQSGDSLLLEQRVENPRKIHKENVRKRWLAATRQRQSES